MNPIARTEAERAGAFYGLTADEVLAKDRSKSRFEARAITAWVLRCRFGFSYPELGRFLGRDHTTIMSAIQRVERELRENSTSFFAQNAMLALQGDMPKATEWLPGDRARLRN